VVVVLLLSFVISADLLDGTQWHQFHLLVVFIFVSILDQQVLLNKPTSVFLLKLFKLRLELVVSPLQVLNKLMLSLHNDDLLVQLVMQDRVCLRLMVDFCH